MTYKVPPRINSQRATEVGMLVLDDTGIVFTYKDIYINKRQRKPVRPLGLLRAVRKELEDVDICMLCNGCRYDVWQSGQQILSTKGYIYRIGRREQPEDLIDIFDGVSDTDLDKIGTIKQQEDHIRVWITSF